MTSIVAVCGMMGSGKSTVLYQLQNALPDCVVIEEDDYNAAPLRSLEEVQAWWQRGGRVAEFDLTELVEQLQYARNTQKRFVLLETQFGRTHAQLRPLIDMQFWIEVEPDVAIARKVAQLSRQMLNEAQRFKAEDSLLWLARFCDSYVEVTRPLFQRQRSQVGDLSDAKVDGHRGPDQVCEELRRALTDP